MEEKTNPTALWSFLATIVLVSVGACLLDGFSILRSQFGLLFTDPRSLSLVDSGNITGVVLASTIFSVFLSIISMFAVNWYLGNNHGSHAVAEFLEQMENQNNFFSLFFLVLVEELFARWFCLGVLPNCLNSNWLVFCTLLFGGNLIWSLLHLFNFRDAQDRNFLRVVPQFVAGLVFSFVYLKYGLLAAIIVHLADNSILLSLHKIEDTMPDKDFWIGAYSLVTSLLSVVFLVYLRKHSPWDMGVWLEKDSGFSVEGWNFWDYLAGSIVVGRGLNMLSIFCCYDQGCVRENGDSEELPSISQLAIALAIIAGAVFVGYWIMGIFSSDVHYRVLLLTILMCFFCRSNSGSGLARNFWINLSNFYIGICIMKALGFFPTVALLGLEFFIYLPILHLQRCSVSTD